MSGRKTLSQRWIVVIGFLAVALFRISLVFADTCQADINKDGKIDTEDLEIMQDELDRDNCFMVPCKADLNGDGKVNGNDGEFLIAEFGQQDCFSGTRDILGEETAFDSAEAEDVEEGVELPGARFIDHENGTVTDPDTGLMWTKNADLYGDTLLFHQARDYIEGMNEGHYANFSYTDWRLPSLSEFRRLIDYTQLTRKGHTLPLGHPFKNLQSLNFNSGSSYISNSDYPLFVSLYCRLVGHNVNACYGYVWPVRGGE